VVASVPIWAASFLYANLGARFSLDLRVNREAAASFLAGHNPYLLHFTSYGLPWTYPPFALLVLSPLSFGSIHLIEALWWLCNFAAMFAILYIAISAVFQRSRATNLAIATFVTPVLSLALEPVRSNTTNGQINVLLFLLVILDIVRVRGRGRGVLIGLAAAIKLTPLIYLLLFVITRDRRSLLRGIVTFMTAELIAYLALPKESVHFWSSEIFHPGLTGTVGSLRNQSLNGLLHRWPFPHDGMTLLWIFFVLLTLSVGTSLAKRLANAGLTIDAVIALGLTGELISPISWTHHWIWVVLIPVLVVRGFKGQRQVTIAMIALILVAAVAPYSWDTHGLTHRVLSDSLTVVALSVLLVWFTTERLRDRN